MTRNLLLAFAFLITSLGNCASAATDQVADSFAIVKEDATETARVVSVRIDRRVTSDQLARIATAIKDANKIPTTRHTVVSFYLPGMPTDQRPWASVDTDPATKVIIGGLRLEETEVLAAELAHDSRPRIGSWLAELPATPGRVTILSENGKAKLERVERNGQRTEEELLATRGTRGTRYDLAAGGDEYYLLKASGELEHRSKDRLIAVYEKLLPAKAEAVSEAPAQMPIAGSEGGALPHAAAQQGLAGTSAAANAAAAALPVAAAVTVPDKPTRVRKVKRGGSRATAARNRQSPVFIVDYMRPQIVN